MKKQVLKIDNIYECEIMYLENEGSGVTRINNFVVFVPKALVGELVKIKIVEIKKNYAVAKLLEIIKPSKHRVEPDCEYYNLCGGCNLRHQTQDKNIEFKQNKIDNAMNKIGKISININNIAESPQYDNYRNKAVFKVEKDKIGFYEQNSYFLVDISYCKLLNDNINKALKVIKGYLKDNTENQIYEITVRYALASDELLIDILSKENEIKLVEYIKDNIKNIKSISLNNNLIYGNKYIDEVVNNLMFKYSAKSFFQINTRQAENLYNYILNLNYNSNDMVLDLYSGVGTISSIISRKVKHVYGIEIEEEAIECANENIKLNNINNVTYIHGNADTLYKIKDKIDVVILDPPRGGSNKKTLDQLLKLNPNKIIYISCNPVTLARDINYIYNFKYTVSNIKAFDMFPNTSHVECVSLLQRKNP